MGYCSSNCRINLKQPSSNGVSSGYCYYLDTCVSAAVPISAVEYPKDNSVPQHDIVCTRRPTDAVWGVLGYQQQTCESLWKSRISRFLDAVLISVFGNYR